MLARSSTAIKLRVNSLNFVNTLKASMPLSKGIHAFRRFTKLRESTLNLMAVAPSSHRAILYLLLLISFPLFSSPIDQTQTNLKKLNAQIVTLKQTLVSAQDEREMMHQKLSSTEKQIGEGIYKLHSIQKNRNAKAQKIDELEIKINQLNQKLKTQQHLLAKHVRARYQMGEYPAVKWIIDQDEPYKISQLLIYYQYIVKSRQKLIDQIENTRKHIKEHQEVLQRELNENALLSKELSLHQEQLIKHKRYHSDLIQSLNNEIQNKKHSLEEAEKKQK